jgi:hypothetical protein
MTTSNLLRSATLTLCKSRLKSVLPSASSSCRRNSRLCVLFLLIGPNPVHSKRKQNIHARRNVDDIDTMYMFPFFMAVHGNSWLAIDQNTFICTIHLVLHQNMIRCGSAVVDLQFYAILAHPVHSVWMQMLRTILGSGKR